MTIWHIVQLERELADNGVVVAHWRATDEDGTHSASSFGTCSFTPDPADPSYITYASLTESDVLGWCWANGVDKDAVEASLAANIYDQQNPTSAVGTPW